VRSNAVGDTYKAKSVCIGVFVNVFRQVSTGHPFRNKLERGGGDAEEWDNIFVFQVLPHYNLLVESLNLVSSSRQGT